MTFHHPDTRILGTIGRFAIETAKHEVDLRDGSLHAFRFVRDPQDPEPRSRYLRAIEMPDGMTAVFDLRLLARSLATDLPGYTERDRHGLIKYTLRPLYATASSLYLGIRSNWIVVGKLDQQLEAEYQARAAA